VSGTVYERVLGADLERLPETVRAGLTARAGGVGEGVFAFAGSTRRLLRPLLWMMARQRILFPESGTDVPFRIVNTPTADGGVHAVRTFRFPSGDRVLEDTLHVVDGHLHDVMGRRGGFEVRMTLSVEGERLVMRSERQWLRRGPFRTRLPQFARVTVVESVAAPAERRRRHIDVRLRSPLLGEWFRYAGDFDYACAPEDAGGSEPHS
jgi:hypothetical protein